MLKKIPNKAAVLHRCTAQCVWNDNFSHNCDKILNYSPKPLVSRLVSLKEIMVVVMLGKTANKAAALLCFAAHCVWVDKFAPKFNMELEFSLLWLDLV